MSPGPLHSTLPVLDKSQRRLQPLYAGIHCTYFHMPARLVGSKIRGIMSVTFAERTPIFRTCYRDLNADAAFSAFGSTYMSKVN